MYHMCVPHVCTTSMYHMYVRHLCTTSMYHMYMYASGISDHVPNVMPEGQYVHQKTQMHVRAPNACMHVPEEE